ncbi:MAG: hypothetical protein IJ874_02395 [Ruminococcus sp.]|nr:hypothetical protein [Ruminococcus sp.]
MTGYSKTVKKMNQLTAELSMKSMDEQRSVHRELLIRSLRRLREDIPGTEQFFAPMVKDMLHSVRRPDKKGDRENGRGLHYYCAVRPSGKQIRQISGYFLSGTGDFRSARTMLEEDYTTALSLHHAGYIVESADYLGRAVHMLSDICCPPHAAGMTYFSVYSGFHRAYERLAAAIYPEFMPDSQQTDDSFFSRSYFTGAAGFAGDLNRIARSTAAELEAVKIDPAEEVASRLVYTEKVTAQLLRRFFEDSTADPETACYPAGGEEVTIVPGTQPMSVRITSDGIKLHGVNPSQESRISLPHLTLRAAHRHGGYFTFSPVSDKSGRVLEVRGKKLVLRDFDPRRKSQQFRLK